jgi:hypothetical protein
MDTELQIPKPDNLANAQSSSSKVSATHHLVFGLVSLLVLVAGIGAVYLWQHHKVNELNDKLNNYQAALIKDSRISLDKLNALMALPNVVEDSANSPTDLIAFLGANNTQCYKGNQDGYFKVVAQANDQFAKMQYGCAAKGSSTPQGPSPTYILARKTNNEWSTISPTNQWLTVNGQELPSCTMVNSNKVSKLVTPECWNGPAVTGSTDVNSKSYSTVPVTNP